MALRRFAQVTRLKPEKREYYLKLHADTWPCVLDKIGDCNIKNYSIFLYEDLLFAYFEYYGDNFELDMQKMAEDPCTKEWWEETAPCQESLSDNPGEWWLNIPEVFHTD